LVCDYEVIDGIIRVNCLNCVYGSSIEDSDVCMARVIDKILEIKKVERIILAETREYEYDFEQTRMLVEIANVFNKLLNEDKILNISRVTTGKCDRCTAKWYADLQFLVLDMIRRDPIGAYVKVTRTIRHIRNKIREAPSPLCKQCYGHYLENTLIPIQKALENTKIIKLVKDKLEGHRIGDRQLYREIFHPLIRPNFMLTRYMATPPENGRPVERYRIGDGDTLVEIFRIPDKVRYFYFISPPEFRLSEEQYILLDTARRYMAEHKPTETEFTEPEKAREMFMNIGRDMIRELANNMRIPLTAKELERLANILSRYTAGFGILEVILSDEKLQDIYINSPIGLTPIYVLHSDFEECETNLIPTREDAEAWATRFRMFSGRPLDEANPVLDTELLVPGGRARVCAITRTLSPEGLGYAFRRHRDRPWTFPLFINVRMIDPLYAGLMSFMVDGGRSCLLAGGRSSGKTSLLSALLLEIMKKFRIVVTEDSVTGDCEILYERNGKLERNTVGNLIDFLLSKYGSKNLDGREILDWNPEEIKIFSIDNNGRVVLSKVSKFIRHKVRKDIFEIETCTGKKIKVTGDHSLFTLDDQGNVSPVKVKNLKIGDFLATPRMLPIENKEVLFINLLDNLNKIKGYITGPEIEKFIKTKREVVKNLAKEMNYSKTTVEWWIRKNILPAKIFQKLVELGYNFDTNNLYFKCSGTCEALLPVKIKLDHDFLTFIGLWFADGCYDKGVVIISAVDENSRNIIQNIAKRFGAEVRIHSAFSSLMIIHSTILKKIMRNVLSLRGNSFAKRIPEWGFTLSKKQIGFILKGLYSGDGYITRHEVVINLVSRNLIKDIQTLLLTFNIIGRINRQSEGKTYSLKISRKSLKSFFKHIGFLQKDRVEKLQKICERKFTHDTSDIIPFSLEFKKSISKVFREFNYDHVKRNNNIGREKLNEFLRISNFDGCNGLFKKMKILATSDIFWDQIRNIKHIKNSKEYVYDFSVPGCENFLCENILAHNTLEIPVPQMRNLGYNIERLKSRSVITRVEAELPADEALRTALRLGDSVLVVGEVRSLEAKALFEAMRIGALANTVAGTIHGESAYGVFDRVVNDLGVPATSFKAIDIITISNMLRSPDGIHRFRRVVEVTEVRKRWREDPVEEGGFVNLMQYSAKEDKLVPTDTLLNGESFVINEIMKRVREWHDNWDAVWSNIELRAKIKKAMVDYAVKLNRFDILEANWVVESNEIFHMISDKVRREVGALDSKMIFERWDEWFRNKLKGKK